MKKKKNANDIIVYSFNDKLSSLKNYINYSENVIDDEIYINMENIVLKYSDIFKQYYSSSYSLYIFMEQYIDLTSKLLIKYNREQNSNIYDINNFINIYVEENLEYQKNIFKEFYKFDLIEERSYYNKYFINSLKKVMQVLSVIYRKDLHINSEEVYKKSKVNTLSEKAKKIVDFIIELNKSSLRINQYYLFDTTNTLVEFAASLSNIIVDNEDDFKVLISYLYKVFWDNGQKIRNYANNDELNFINNLRNFYFHDIEHGTGSEVRKKYRRVKKFFMEACGKSIPETAKEWQKVQEYIYDKLLIFLDEIKVTEDVTVVC